jgi:hypothetical protein
MECKYCKANFSTKTNLNQHQRTAKYCLKIQGKDKELKYECGTCGKKFGKKFNLIRHEEKCVSIEKFFIMKKQLLKVESERNTFKENYQKQYEDYKEIKIEYQELLEAYQRLAELYIIDGKNKVDGLNKKFLKKRCRTKYEGQNVIYILTTPGLKKERRYILGKATNLTNRLSTYNKTDEHEVVFYSSCPNKEKMSVVEGMVFNKLEVYREQANRERFILPVDRKIDLFSETIKKCIDFIK